MEAVVTREFAIKRVQEIARAEAQRGSDLTFAHVASRCPLDWPPRLIAEGCELAGFPVWSSAPEEALDA